MGRTVYYSPESDDGLGTVYRAGEAWQVDPDPSSPMEDGASVAKLELDEQTTAALFQLGIVEKLQHLPMEFGPIDEYEEAILLPQGLVEGAGILRSSCNALPQGNQDVYCGSQVKPEQIEYRMVIDTRMVSKTIARLADFFEEAVQKQLGIQLWF